MLSYHGLFSIVSVTHVSVTLEVAFSRTPFWHEQVAEVHLTFLDLGHRTQHRARHPLRPRR
jgi:hypothetical protein